MTNSLRSDYSGPCQLSVIIPAFQEGEHLARSLAVVVDIISGLTAGDYEVIVVDDGSRDQTWDVVGELHRVNPRIGGLRLSRNFGKEYAVAAGLEHAEGDGVLILDADLQHPPTVIPKLYAIWKSGEAQVVEGVKRQRQDEPLLRRTFSRAFNALAGMATGIQFTNSSDFKLIDRSVVEAWRQMGEKRCFMRGMVSWVGFTHVRVEFDVAPRCAGSSKWNAAALLGLAGRAIISYSAAPLRLIHITAVSFLLFGVLLGCQTLYMKFSGRSVSGFTTVIILQLFIGGLLLLSLGLVAEYIAAIYDEVKGRPRYVLRQSIHAAPASRRSIPDSTEANAGDSGWTDAGRDEKQTLAPVEVVAEICGRQASRGERSSF